MKNIFKKLSIDTKHLSIDHTIDYVINDHTNKMIYVCCSQVIKKTLFPEIYPMKKYIIHNDVTFTNCIALTFLYHRSPGTRH